MGQRPLQRGMVGQTIAAVDEALLGVTQHLPGSFEVVEEKSGRLVDGLAYGARRVILSGVAGECVEMGTGFHGPLETRLK